MSDRSPQTKAARQARILGLLEHAAIASQTELGERLTADGFAVSQGTLSRDLVELGAVRVRSRDGTHTYALLARERAEAGASAAKLARVCAELLISAEASANLVIVKTPPGAAQYLASALDKVAWDTVLGTIAGDDSVLVVTRDPQGGRRLAERLLALAERNEGVS